MSCCIWEYGEYLVTPAFWGASILQRFYANWGPGKSAFLLEAPKQTYSVLLPGACQPERPSPHACDWTWQDVKAWARRMRTHFPWLEADKHLWALLPLSWHRAQHIFQGHISTEGFLVSTVTDLQALYHLFPKNLLFSHLYSQSQEAPKGAAPNFVLAPSSVKPDAHNRGEIELLASMLHWFVELPEGLRL